MTVPSEIIIVRSLADSDLGIFSAHRASASSHQRAFAMTTDGARRLLSAELFEARAGLMDIICVYGSYSARERRLVNRASKNWRLGGTSIDAKGCAFLDSKDFMLLRSLKSNDGSTPVLMTFVGRQRERLIHAGIAASLQGQFRGSTFIAENGSDIFAGLAAAFPPVPADFAVGLARATSEMETDGSRRTASCDG
ncbi:hypothetical protein [Sphingopyxis sp. R3-92]|uniref:hypothetical protein n=1 Tax=Sphingopyxis sp. R3-92 TaxID=3158553 RepID=UPI003EE59105